MSLRHLAEAIEHRRLQLNLTQHEVASRGGPSANTVSNLERGLSTGVSKHSLKALDVGLDWEPGHAAGLHARRDDRPATTAAARPTRTDDPARAEIRARALDLAIRSTAPLLPNAGVNAIAHQHLQLAARYDNWIRTGGTLNG